MAGGRRNNPHSAAASRLFASSAPVASSKQIKNKRKLREPVSVDAMPLSSSSDNDEEDKTQSQKTPPSTGGGKATSSRKDDIEDIDSSSSNEDSHSRRADIGQTVFRPSSDLPSREKAKKSTALGAFSSTFGRDRNRLPVKAKRLVADDEEDEISSSSSRGTKRPRPKASQPRSQSQSQSSQSQLSRKYGQTASKAASSSQSQASQSRRRMYDSKTTSGSKPSSVSNTNGRSTSGTATFKIPRHHSDKDDDVSDVDNGKKTGKKKAKFVRPHSLSPETVTPKKAFKHRKSTGVEEGEDELSPLPKAKFKVPGRAPSSSQESREAKSRASTEPRSSGMTLSQTRKKKWREEQRKKHQTSGLFGALELEKPADEESGEEEHQPAVFKMPARFGLGDENKHDDVLTPGEHDFGSLDDDGLLSSLDDTQNKNGDTARMTDQLRQRLKDGWLGGYDSGKASDDTMAYEEPVVCPLCSAPLTDEVLRELLPETDRNGAGGGDGSNSVRLYLMKFEEKMSFCAAHKRHTARSTWTTKGYPDIDWAGLEGRLEVHYDHLLQVLEGEIASPFRDSLQQGGKSRSSSDQSEVTGYYGQRGLQVMADAIVQQFSSELRRRAVADPVISSHGYSRYVKLVLVPELATQLVQEDMGVDAERAREILEESAAMGELMHEEVDIIDEDEDDDEDDDEGEDYDDNYD